MTAGWNPGRSPTATISIVRFASPCASFWVVKRPSQSSSDCTGKRSPFFIEAGGGVHVGVGLLDEGLKATDEVPDVPDAAVVEELQASRIIEISVKSGTERVRIPHLRGQESIRRTLAPCHDTVKADFGPPGAFGESN